MKKTKRKAKSKRKTRPRSLLTKQGKAIEANLEDIVNQEIAEHRKLTPAQIHEFLLTLLPKEQVVNPIKSAEDIDKFEVTGGGSVTFKPEENAKESPKEAPKEAPKDAPKVSSEEESDDTEEEDTADEVTDEIDTEEEPVQEDAVAKQVVLKTGKQVQPNAKGDMLGTK